MADTLTLSNFTGLTENGAATLGSTLNTGDLRRKYAFGAERISELSIMQDVFFRFLAMQAKEPVDDTQFKFTEERPSFHKRYAYVVAHSNDGSTFTSNDATVTATDIEVGDTWYVQMKTDYKNSGNIGSRFGNVSSKVDVGDAGTRPKFFLKNQIIKFNFGPAFNNPKDYILGRIIDVQNITGEAVQLQLEIIRTLSTATNNELQWSSATAPMGTVYNIANANIEAGLESKKSYIVGNAFARGSGYPDTWADQPYSTGYGLTQIWKTALGMDNSTIASVLKYKGNEWARIWSQKLIEHKWDIETDLLFGSQYTATDGTQFTQGAVDYLVNYGNIFSLDHATKTSDDFLDDLSQFLDPRINNSSATLFMCDTFTYNWLNKLSGYFSNVVTINSQYRANMDFQSLGSKSILGVPVNTISTIYGNMNIARNVHLDGSGVHILAINLNNVKYCPLVGNGLNRDTTIYVGVQTLQNSGVDKRVDLILTEAGTKWTLPESHAAWLAN